MTKKPAITREAEHQLGLRILKGDKAARQELAMAHYPFVVWIASGYFGCGAENVDLVQAGMVGLLEAIDRFDPHRPTRLLTLAYWAIRRHIIDAIKEAVGDGEKVVRYTLDGYLVDPKYRFRIKTSLDTSIGEPDEQPTLGSTIADERATSPLQAASESESLGIAKRALKRAKTRTRQIVRMRLGTNRDKLPGMSFVAIGKHFGISAERARRIFIHAMARIRSRLEGD